MFEEWKAQKARGVNVKDKCRGIMNETVDNTDRIASNIDCSYHNKAYLDYSSFPCHPEIIKIYCYNCHLGQMN